MMSAARNSEVKLIAYRRVSTQEQGQSGLGLEAQEAAIARFSTQHGGRTLKTYTEVETGKRSDRPELLKAISHAKRSGATLVMSKLDRLARNAPFLLTLQKSGLPLVFCDLAGANEFTVGIMALVADNEAQLISKRTKEALAAYKARGGLLGASLPQCRNLTQKARERGAKAAGEAVKAQAEEAYQDLSPVMVEMREQGSTLQQIAASLNEQGHTTRRGKPWNHVQVMRVLERSGK